VIGETGGARRGENHDVVREWDQLEDGVGDDKLRVAEGPFGVMCLCVAHAQSEQIVRDQTRTEKSLPVCHECGKRLSNDGLVIAVVVVVCVCIVVDCWFGGTEHGKNGKVCVGEAENPDGSRDGKRRCVWIALVGKDAEEE